MERRPKRVSATQWEIILDFLEKNTSIARGYNNTSRGRETSQRLWNQLADLLNAEGSGSQKTPKEWATTPTPSSVTAMSSNQYFNNFKSKLKKIVSDLNNGVTGGPDVDLSNTLTDLELRVLALMRPGFGPGNPNTSVNGNPFNVNHSEPQKMDGAESNSNEIETADAEVIETQFNPEVIIKVEMEQTEEPAETNMKLSLKVERIPELEERLHSPPIQVGYRRDPVEACPSLAGALTGRAGGPTLPRYTPNTRYRRRPLAPRISPVETRRADDAANTRALNRIGRNLGRIAAAFEQYLSKNG